MIESLEERDIEFFRTDDLGSIVIQTDGYKLTWLSDFNDNRVTNKKAEAKGIYIGNINSKIFHDKDCNSLPKEENQIIFNSKEEAIEKGYTSHSVCIK